MQLNSYQMLCRCLRLTKKITVLSKLTAIGKNTLTRIAKGRGKYNGCLSTQMRLEDFMYRNQKEIDEIMKKRGF